MGGEVIPRNGALLVRQVGLPCLIARGPGFEIVRNSAFLVSDWGRAGVLKVLSNLVLKALLVFRVSEHA